MYIIQSMVVLFLFAGLLSPALPAGGQSASPATARSGLPAEAQSASPAMDRSADQHAGYMDIDDVKPGMRGYGLTVFQDARIDTFDVEVIGVIKNQFYTDHDIIMVGVSGPYVDEAGVIAGMSGSPVYIDGKLVGALAYRFGAFPMKPIGGVTPIGHMLDIREVVETETKPGSNAPDGTPGGMGGGQNDLGPPDLGPPGFHPSGLGPSGLKPIAVPMVFSGFHPGTVSLFEDELRRRGLVPVAGGSVAGGSVAGGSVAGASGRIPGSKAGDVAGSKPDGRAAVGADANPEQEGLASTGNGTSLLEPGSAVSAQLIRGDYNMAGTGTVTWREDDAILAFGHPFLWTGALNVPMNRAEIITVIPDQTGSTKISSVADEVGSVLWDHTNGIYGQLGDTARMIPVELSYDDAIRAPRTYRFDVMMANGWTPLLVNMAVSNTILANGRIAGERTIAIGGRIALQDHPDIVFDDQFSGQASLSALARDVNGVLDFVLDNRFITPMIESLRIDIHSSDERSTAVIEDVWFGSETVEPGDTLEVRVYLRPYRGDRLVRRMDVTIPKTVSAGSVQVLVGSARAVTRHDLNAVPQRYRPTDGPRLIELLNNRRTGNRVYLKMFQGGAGGMVKGREMPGLPPSVLAVMNSERTKGSFVPIREKVVAEETIRTDYVVAGQNWSRLTVKR
ncbi:MAG: hypothetical protein OXH56_00540 [Gemmatimonadetes bacterium]|nr:hypothetical protein [Gemmatimonadota bacterium]